MSTKPIPLPGAEPHWHAGMRRWLIATANGPGSVEPQPPAPDERPASDIADLRALLRAFCTDCVACGESVADDPTDGQLAAWLRGEPGGEGSAWHSHLHESWRAH